VPVARETPLNLDAQQITPAFNHCMAFV